MVTIRPKNISYNYKTNFINMYNINTSNALVITSNY